jgi:hypothetical protein
MSVWVNPVHQPKPPILLLNMPQKNKAPQICEALFDCVFCRKICI